MTNLTTQKIIKLAESLGKTVQSTVAGITTTYLVPLSNGYFLEFSEQSHFPGQASSVCRTDGTKDFKPVVFYETMKQIKCVLMRDIPGGCGCGYCKSKA